ncbi:hypothetical protein HQN84_30140 [Pedobacter steynii]|nr:hypothetical protein [Pedobacter steynii]
MFRRFFKRDIQNRISKIDYWKQWEFFELFDDLHLAEQLLNENKLNPSIGFEEFKGEFIEELYEVEGDNVIDFTRIWEWFNPNNKWDLIMGNVGKDLGLRIFYRTDRWKRNQEFLPETIVSLNNEIGLVLKGNDDTDALGLIRWDTPEEKDVEDWRGLFGSFLQTGGKVIEQDYKLKFINRDGTLKNHVHDS